MAAFHHSAALGGWWAGLPATTDRRGAAALGRLVEGPPRVWRPLRATLTRAHSSGTSERGGSARATARLRASPSTEEARVGRRWEAGGGAGGRVPRMARRGGGGSEEESGDATRAVGCDEGRSGEEAAERSETAGLGGEVGGDDGARVQGRCDEPHDPPTEQANFRVMSPVSLWRPGPVLWLAFVCPPVDGASRRQAAPTAAPSGY